MNSKKIIGFYGYPPRAFTETIRCKYPFHEWIDLDVDLGSPESEILPDNYCRILRNIMDNAIFLKDRIDLIVTSTGSEKCDGGRFLSHLLSEMGFHVVDTRNDSFENTEFPALIDVPISKSALPLDKKVELIMDTVLEDSACEYEETQPTCGFWGVPPHDFDLLKLFPDTAHVYGWTRCVEAERPAEINLEWYVDPGVPTVFFVQSVCAQSQLARWLAAKYGGLFIDVDGSIGMGTRAKIDAFLELNKAK